MEVLYRMAEVFEYGSMMMHVGAISVRGRRREGGERRDKKGKWERNTSNTSYQASISS
jgi:hypothetical protein